MIIDQDAYDQSLYELYRIDPDIDLRELRDAGEKLTIEVASNDLFSDAPPPPETE